MSRDLKRFLKFMFLLTIFVVVGHNFHFHFECSLKPVVEMKYWKLEPLGYRGVWVRAGVCNNDAKVTEQTSKCVCQVSERP